MHPDQTAQCWQYTWLGPQTDKTNMTEGCSDLEGEAGSARPCFTPLVWTYNDDLGQNEPNLQELVMSNAAS